MHEPLLLSLLQTPFRRARNELSGVLLSKTHDAVISLGAMHHQQFKLSEHNVSSEATCVLLARLPNLPHNTALLY